MLDQIILLATGLTAIYLIWRFVQDYRRKGKPAHDIAYIVAFAVLLIAGLLLIGFGYGVLGSPLVVTVAVLIPAGIALGLVSEYTTKWRLAYLIFAIVGLVAIAVTRFTGPALVATIILVIVHSVSGLLIFALPIVAVNKGTAPSGFIGVTVGGALIGIGGIAMAALKTGGQLLFFSAPVVFAILAPLLLLMTLAFTWGFVKKIKAA
ncbi:MAG: hypothetical protein AB1597_01455 [Chloroflexota bacterium]